MNQENDTTAQDVEAIDRFLFDDDGNVRDAKYALNRLTARIATLTEGLRHVVPGNGGMMEVTCEDYDSFVAHSLADIRARAEQAERERDKYRGSSWKYLSESETYRRRVTQLEAALREMRDRKTSTGVPWYPESTREAADLSLSTEGEPAPSTFTSALRRPGESPDEYGKRMAVGEPAEDRCPACGWPDPWQDGEDPTCRDPWHTTPKEDR